MLIVHFFLRIIYRAIAATGFFSTKFGQWVYRLIYENFKLFSEGKDVKMISSYIKSDSLVIDVGANIGFHTNFFLNRISPDGKVVAIEPDLENLKYLRMRFSEKLKSGHLVLIDRVATDKEGDYFLSIDSCNPGGHKIAPEGMPIKGITIDQIISQIGIVPSFIKIDVEGYEEFVILGAEKTINEYHPAIFMEFHPGLLSEYGTDPVNLLQNLENHGYELFLFGKKERLYKVSIEGAVKESKRRGWKDIILISEKDNA